MRNEHSFGIQTQMCAYSLYEGTMRDEGSKAGEFGMFPCGPVAWRKSLCFHIELI